MMFTLLYATADASVCRCHNGIPPDTFNFFLELRSLLLCGGGFFLCNGKDFFFKESACFFRFFWKDSGKRFCDGKMELKGKFFLWIL